MRQPIVTLEFPASFMIVKCIGWGFTWASRAGGVLRASKAVLLIFCERHDGEA
jgi:hypothetical protein